MIADLEAAYTAWFVCGTVGCLTWLAAWNVFRAVMGR